MTEEHNESISYFVFEGLMTHMSKIIKRLIVLCFIILVLWASTIAGFLWYISLPVEEVSTIAVENEEGNANYIGNDMNGDFNYGESN